MNNLAISLKKFLTNKNTVTIIGVVFIIAILYFMYTKTVDDKIKEVEVPAAAETIYQQSYISEDLITTIKIASAAKPDDKTIETNKGAIVGKYTGVGVTIPKGSMFYKEFLVNQDELPGNWIRALAEGEKPFQLPTSVEATYGNSIQPGDYIDIYVLAKDPNDGDKLVFGRMIENAHVLSVTTSEGENVFKSQTEILTPAYLNFGLQEDYFYLMETCINLPDELDLMVVPHGGQPPQEELSISTESKYIHSYIETRISEKVDHEKVEMNSDKKNQTQENNQNPDNQNTNNQPVKPTA